MNDAKPTKLPKIKAGAIKAARKALGAGAEEGEQFVVWNTGAGYDWRPVTRAKIGPKKPLEPAVPAVAKPVPTPKAKKDAPQGSLATPGPIRPPKVPKPVLGQPAGRKAAKKPKPKAKRARAASKPTGGR